MQADEDLTLLPRRNSQHKAEFKNSRPVSFYSNLYELDFQSKLDTIFQFVLDATPQVKKDSPKIYKKIYHSARKDIQSKIGEFMDSGDMIWGFKSLSKPTIFQSEFDLDGEHHKYDLTIKQVKELDFNDFIRNGKTQASIIQLINAKIKMTLKNHMNMYELGRGRYYNEKIEKIHNLDLDVRKGFKLTVCPVNKNLLVQIDVCSRITRSYNFSEDIAKMNEKEANDKFMESTVITREGKIRTFRI
jgi:hypothetical protein